MGTVSINSIRRGKTPARIHSVGVGPDGHNYYLIDDDGSKGVANVTFIQYYSSLNQYGPSGVAGGGSDPSGFFFVRDAASNGSDHYGDPTVHAGWAMYIFDPTLYNPASSNSGWVKIAQQGDIDWDITDELKSLFVLKTVYNVKMNQIDSNFIRVDGVVININARVNVLERDMQYVYPKAHVHWNRYTLDLLSTQNGTLYYNNRPIGGNSYIYDHVEKVNGVREIVWCDPTIDREQWTHEVIDDSETIAEMFCKTTMARIGLTLIVVEADGSLSMFKYGKEATDVPTYHGPFNISTAVSKATEYGYVAPVYTPGDITTLAQGSWTFEPNNGIYFTYDETSGEYVPYPDGDAALEVQADSTDQLYVYDPQGFVLRPKFAQTIVPENLGLAEYVFMLPPAAKQYVGRGYWVPLVDDGEHVVGHLHHCIPVFAVTQDTEFNEDRKYFRKIDGSTDYEQLVYRRPIKDSHGETIGYTTGDYKAGDSVEDFGETVYYKEYYIWEDATGATGTLGLVGSVIDVCYAENHTMWTRNHIHFTIPPTGTKLTPTGLTAAVKWAKTVIVRKFGKPPANAADGEVVYTFTADRLEEGETTWFVDTVPFISLLKNDLQEQSMLKRRFGDEDTPALQYWYYRAFSTSKAGDAYTSDITTFPEVAAKPAKKLDWEMIWQMARASKLDLVFKPGDEIYLPHHKTYGDILCQVVEVKNNPDNPTKNGLVVITKEVLCEKMLDNVELESDSGVLNPENLESGILCGSNGALGTELCPTGHNLNTLNIIVWLNSVEAPGGGSSGTVYQRTDYDTDPDYDDARVGFLSGFDEDDLQLFGTFDDFGDGDTYYLGADATGTSLRVRLPFMTDYNNNAWVRQDRHLGRDKEFTRWATLTGVPYEVLGRQRRLCKFQLNTLDEHGDREDVFPEEKVGIVPMFFIQGLNPNRIRP